MKNIFISIMLALMPYTFIEAQINFGGNTRLLRSTGVVKRGNPYHTPRKPMEINSGIRYNQSIHYNDGSSFYGTIINGRRFSGRLVDPNGTEYVGIFDENGYLNGVVEISYVSDRVWFKGNYNHGTPHGQGSMYKNGKYYDVQYDNGDIVASVEVSEPNFKGENWYAKTLEQGVPRHQFFGSGGAGRHTDSNNTTIIYTPTSSQTNTYTPSKSNSDTSQKTITCAYCNGTGRRLISVDGGIRDNQYWVRCSECGHQYLNTSTHRHVSCSYCHGTGKRRM